MFSPLVSLWGPTGRKKKPNSVTVLILKIDKCLFEIKNQSLQKNKYTFLVSSQSVPPFIFWDCGSSLPLLLWILFKVDCLYSLYLVVLLGFYLVPSSGIYFPAISFYLTFYVCGLCSSELTVPCRTVIFLVSGVCLLVGKLDSGLVQASWWEGRVLAIGGWGCVLSCWLGGPCQGMCL